MKKSWNIQVIMFVVFFFVFGTLSAGAADSKKTLLKPQKMILQKTSPSVTKKKTSPSVIKMVKQKALPDLSVLSIKITPKNPMDSDKINIETVIQNIGKIATSPSLLKIQIGGKIYPLIKVPRLSINQKWKYNSKVNIKRPGNYRITANINPNKRVAESNFKNNTRIKNFRIRESASKSKRVAIPKSQPPTQDNPPPPLTPADELRPTPTLMTQVSQPIEMTMVSKYHAKFLEFDVRLAPEGYYWEALYKNTGTEGLPNWGYFIRVFQISRDGSEQKAGYDSVMTYLSPGATGKVVDTMAWQKNDDTISLRIEMWRNVYTGNHRFITNKTIPFPIKVLPREMEMHSPAEPLAKSLVNSKIVRHSAVTSGPIASQLAIPDNIYRNVKIKSSEYLGQGRWKVEIINNGNFFVHPNQIEVFSWFFGLSMPAEFESGHFKNKTTLSPNETETIIGFGLNQNGECGKLHEINFIAHDTVNDRKDFVIIELPRPSAVIDHITIRNGAFACDLENKSPFSVKAKIRIVTIEIWDDYKLKERDTSVLGFIKDLVYEDGPGIDFDSSGYDPQVLKCSATNIELGTVTIPAATSSSPYSGVAIWGISAYQFKQLIRAKCPNADFGSYSYIFKNLKVELITENITSCNTSHLGYTTLHVENVGNGGSKDSPAFSW